MNKNKKTKVLVVEDDQFLMNAYLIKLEKEGFDVKGAMDGEEGLKYAKEMVPHIILLDLMMPRMDGYQVLEALQKNTSLKKIPVVILSNLGQQTDIKRGMDLGAIDYLVKANLSIEEVVEKVLEYTST